MSLTVNQNIGAMNAHYYLQKSETAFGKAIERLSSGLRINRAADDPAGLVLSEKYRAQVEGLQQAIQNAQDGINLVQTSEGALDEVTTILRSMRKLAVHAASTGTTDADAAAADQQQLESAISQLNDLAANTQFGSRKLLNGESGTTGTVTGANSSSFEFMAAGENVAEGVYTVEITTAATKAEVASRATLQTQAFTGAVTTPTLGTTNNGDTFTIGVNGTNYVFTADNTGAAGFDQGDGIGALIDAINADANLQDLGIRATNTGGLTITTDANVTGQITMTATGNLLTDMGAAVWNGAVSTGTDATATSTFAQAQTLTFAEGAKKAVVTIAAGSTMQAAATQVTNALNSAQISATFEFASGEFSLTNSKYGDSTATGVTIMASEAGSGSNMNFVASAGNTLNIASGDADLNTVTAGANVVATINTVPAASASGLNFTSADGLEMTTVGGTAADGHTAVVTVAKNELTFQIGAFQNQTVNISLNNVASSELGKGTGLDTKSVANIDLTSAQGAQEAIQVIDAALGEISEMRADLGSFQKDVLESAVRNLGIAAQNMASSESSIRDADMAEEMMDFSRAQILQSTSMAMLAQANQAPQAIMKLFQ